MSFFIVIVGMIVGSSAQTDPYTRYSPTNVIYYFQNPSLYYRTDYQWHLKNTGQDSLLYLNGVYSTADPGGNVDVGYLEAVDRGVVPTNLSYIKLAMIDSGISLTNPEFAGLVITGRNFIFNNNTDLVDTTGHGTCVAGVMVAKQNGYGIQGMLNNIPSITICKISYRSTDEISNAIYWCSTNNIKIINLDWGVGDNNVNLRNAVLFAQQHGVVLVCAAPNIDQNVDVTPDYPASWKFDNVVSVTSITRTGIKYSPAAWGATAVHLGAPGRVIITTSPFSPIYVYNSGTSLAAPMVTSALVLIANKYPYQSYHYWIERLLNGVIPSNFLISSTISGGRLNMVDPLKNDKVGVYISFNKISGLMSVTVTNGFDSGVYKLQSSTNLISGQWNDVTILENNNSYAFSPTNNMLFFQAKLLDYELPKIQSILLPLYDIRHGYGGYIEGNSVPLNNNTNDFISNEKKINTE